MNPDKQFLLEQIANHLRERLEAFDQSAREAHAKATHEQNKAENKYDTRAIEASYLAEGQARQALEVAKATQELESFHPPSFGSKDAIALGALVELRTPLESHWYFLAPCAGGSELSWNEQTVLVLTPQSPLGQQLVGRKTGELIAMQLGRERFKYKVNRVL